MASLFDGIDMSDPCALWPKMQNALDRLLIGEKVVRSRFGEDEVQFTAINIASLRARIAELKAQCMAKQTRRPRRHAISTGWRSY